MSPGRLAGGFLSKLRVSPAHIVLLELKLVGGGGRDMFYRLFWSFYPAIQLVISTVAFRNVLGGYSTTVMSGLLISSTISSAVGALSAAAIGLPLPFEMSLPISPLGHLAITMLAAFLQSLLLVTVNVPLAYAVSGVAIDRVLLAVAIGYLGSPGAFGYNTIVGRVAFTRRRPLRLAAQLVTSIAASAVPVYFPASALPPVLQPLAYANPSTWAIEVARTLLNGGTLPIGGIAGLLACSLTWFVAGFYVAYRMYRLYY